MVHSSYLTEVFDQSVFPQVMRKVRMKLRNTKYDTIAFRGVSGAAVAFPLAASTGKGLLCVRGDCVLQRIYVGVCKRTCAKSLPESKGSRNRSS